MQHPRHELMQIALRKWIFEEPDGVDRTPEAPAPVEQPELIEDTV